MYIDGIWSSENIRFIQFLISSIRLKMLIGQLNVELNIGKSSIDIIKMYFVKLALQWVISIPSGPLVVAHFLPWTSMARLYIRAISTSKLKIWWRQGSHRMSSNDSLKISFFCPCYLQEANVRSSFLLFFFKLLFYFIFILFFFPHHQTLLSTPSV